MKDNLRTKVCFALTGFVVGVIVTALLAVMVYRVTAPEQVLPQIKKVIKAIPVPAPTNKRGPVEPKAIVEVKPEMREVKHAEALIDNKVKRTQAQVEPEVVQEKKEATLHLIVNPAEETRKVNPMIYGSNLTAKTEFEMDVAKFGQDIGITNFRYPGGGSEGYRWKTASFDFTERYDEAPMAKIENVIKFCEIVGAPLVIQINVESGTAEEAAQWVHYMNKEINYPVAYWQLGNEVYGDWDRGFMSGEEYAKVIKEFSKEMRAMDPTIKIGANWGGPNYQAFDRDVIKYAADDIDFVSFHWYPNHTNSSKPYQGRKHPTAEEVMANSKAVAQIIDRFERMVEQYAPHRKGKIELTFMEWDGSRDAVPSDENVEATGMMWSLANAIFYADTLGHFARHGIEVAQHYDYQEIMFGLIRGWDKQAGWGGSRWDGETIRPKALAIKLFSKHFGDIYIHSELTGSPTYMKEQDWRADSYAGHVPYVEAYTSRHSEEKKISIVLTNKHAQEEFKISINLKEVQPKDKGRVWILNGPNLEAQNDGSPRTVGIKAFELTGVGPSFFYTVPAHSVSVVDIDLKEDAAHE